MPPRRQVVLNGVAASIDSGGALVVDFETIKRALKTGRIVRELRRYQDVRLFALRLGTVRKPLFTAMLIRSLSRRSARFEDAHRSVDTFTFARIVRLVGRAAADLVRVPGLLRRVDRTAARLEAGAASRASRLSPGAPVYIRSDLWFGVQSGGSVGQIAGVINEFDGVGTERPVLLTTDPIPTVRLDLETHVILPEARFWDFRQLPSFAVNERLVGEAERVLRGRPVSFVYQRYGANTYGGLELARRWGVPFALEYKGSEVWTERNWGRPLRQRRSLRIEDLVLHSADLVVVVIEAMGSELLRRDVAEERIVVTPNGVDTDRYAPTGDGDTVRERLGLGDTLVVGFIGTFGLWHGAEVLAEIGRLIEDADLQARLGAAAPARAVEAHTWRAHTRRIVEALEARVGRPPDA